MSQTQFSIYDASAGAGKTFTLVKEYLKIILKAPTIDAYRSVLAITFTNKAVNEMKSRVINTLQGFSLKDIPDSFKVMRQMISDEIGLSHEEIQDKSARIFNHLLHNYAAFDILTIDKFTHRVVRCFAADVGLPPDFELTLDMDQLLQQAVERIIEKTGLEPEITSVLLDFILQKSEDDKSWDVFQDLLKFSKLLKSENHLSEIQLLKEWDLSSLSELQKKLRNNEKQIQKEVTQLGEEVLQRIEEQGVAPNHFYRSIVYNYFVKVSKGLVEPYDLFDKYMTLPDSRYSKATPTPAKNAIDNIADYLIEVHDKIKVYATDYQWISVALPNLVPLSFLHVIQNELARVQDEQNVVALASFNKIIHDQLVGQPALFIYEKIGERYRHFFIDEFQDTSVLQWENLIPLIANALAGESNVGVRGTAMIVGDPKQAIYRWRGGRAEQFISLSQNENPFPNHEKALIPLTTNHRSTKEVISFNNDFFAFLSKYFDNDAYKALYAERSFQHHTTKEGGGVQIQFSSPELTKDERYEWYLKKVLETIEKEVQNGYALTDIVVLTRKNEHGIRVAQYLTEKKIPIISSESLLVAQAEEVKVLEHMLRYLNTANTESLAEAFYLLHRLQKRNENVHDWISDMLWYERNGTLDTWFKNEGYAIQISQLKCQPLYLLVDDLVRHLLYIKQSNAHVQFFLDFVWEHEKVLHHGLDSFMTQWDLKKEKLSIAIPEHIDAVRIMTVHKSKGLEFPIVIYPFVEEDFSRKIREFLWVDTPDESWKLNKILVQESTKMASLSDNAHFQFETHQQEAMLDRMNILYVSLTRAEQKLFVFTNLELTSKGEFRQQTLSYFFVDFLISKQLFDLNQTVYEFGFIEAKNGKKREEKVASHFDENFESISSSVIKIAPQDVFMWGSNVEEAIAWGNVWHELMAHIVTVDDIDRAISIKIKEGVLSQTLAEALKNTMQSLIMLPELYCYYNDTLEVYNEKPIILPGGQLLKPDRVVKKTDGSWGVLEYKTGKTTPKHIEQIQSYASVLEQMGLQVSTKTLVYINELDFNVVEL